MVRREVPAGWEIYDVALPAVIAVKKGLNTPRRPSLRGTMAARKKPIDPFWPRPGPAGLELLRLALPPDTGTRVELLGEAREAVPRIVDLFRRLAVL